MIISNLVMNYLIIAQIGKYLKNANLKGKSDLITKT